MADMILMRCQYCGGTLTNVEGNVWFCENCGTSSVVNTSSAGAPVGDPAVAGGFVMTVGSGGRVSNYAVRDRVEFQIAFDRRATMADPDPVIVSLIVDGRPRGSFEHLPRTGKGSVTFESDGQSVFAYATGKASFVKGDHAVTEDEDAEGTYFVAGLRVTIGRTGEMEK